MINLTFNHEPHAKQRPRFTRLGGGRTYDPQSKLKKGIVCEAINQMRDKSLSKLSEGILQAEVYAYSTPPSSWSQKRLKCVQENESFKTTKPDVDNVVKFYLDILNGIAYDDDRQICRLISEKRYSSKPRVEIIITPL